MEEDNWTNDRCRDTRELRVDVGGNGELQELPLLLWTRQALVRIRRRDMGRTIKFCEVTPFASPVLMTAFMKMISVSLTVKSSSFLWKAPDQRWKARGRIGLTSLPPAGLTA